jgi:hypothetical protein
MSRVQVGILVRNRSGADRSIRSLILGGVRPVHAGSIPALLSFYSKKHKKDLREE